MYIKNVTQKDLDKALKIVNKKFSNNVIWNNFKQLSKNRFQITLRVKSSKEPGHRVSAKSFPTDKQKRLISACWHVHGEFFDALPKDAEIRARNLVIKPGDAWNDCNIGSMMFPTYFSEACECSK